MGNQCACPCGHKALIRGVPDDMPFDVVCGSCDLVHKVRARAAGSESAREGGNN